MASGGESLLRFYRALPTAAWIGDDVLRLPEGISWFLDASIGRDIYVRDCYRYRGLRAVLLGTPGIGKSTAVLYFIWRLLRDTSRRPRVIIYRPQLLHENCVVFREAGVPIVRTSIIDHGAFDSSGVLDIYDGAAPRNVYPARRIWLISSPRKDVWGDFAKHMAAARWYMPTFSLSELFRCREVAYPSIATEVVEMLYERWGRSARFTLRLISDAAQRDLVKDADSAADNLDLSAAVANAHGGTGEYGISPHILFHLAVSPGFDDCWTVFASYFCRDLVVARAVAKGTRQAVNDFLAASEGSPALGSFRGHLFERLALSALFSQERDWEMNALDVGGLMVMESLRQRPSFVFSNITELLDAWHLVPDALGRPRNSNWPTWDAVTKDDAARLVTFWQLTVSPPAAHGLKGSGLILAEPLVPDGYSVRLVFVVLAACGGMLIPSRAVPIVGDVPAWATDMPQFVLHIALDDGIIARAGADATASVLQVEHPELQPWHLPVDPLERRRSVISGNTSVEGQSEACLP